MPANDANGQYAIASCPCEDRRIEIQILRKPDDKFSELLFSSLKANDRVEVQGPYGEFVLEDVYAAGTTGQLQVARRLFLEQGLPEQQCRAGAMDV